MSSKKLDEVMRRIQAWPEAAQDELADIALEIDARMKGGRFDATLEELAGIDGGLEAARKDRFATDEQVEATFAKHRPKS